MSFGNGEGDVDVDDDTVGIDNVDSQMWTSFFHVGVAFLNQTALQVSTLKDLFVTDGVTK
jgi:hypothetical protein